MARTKRTTRKVDGFTGIATPVMYCYIDAAGEEVYKQYAEKKEKKHWELKKPDTSWEEWNAKYPPTMPKGYGAAKFDKLSAKTKAKYYQPWGGS
jgi:hypothetical protein